MLHGIRQTLFGPSEGHEDNKRAKLIESLRKQLREIESQVQRLEEQQGNARFNASLGEDYRLEEGQRDAKIGAEIGVLRERAAGLYGQIAAVEAEQEAADAKIRVEAALDRLRSIPRRRKHYIAAVENVERLTRELGDAMREHVAAGTALGEALNTAEARKHFRIDSIIYRYCALAKHFGITPPGPEGGISQKVFLYVSINTANQDFRRSLSDLEGPGLAELANFYATRADAETARRLADPGGKVLHAWENTAAHVWVLRRGTLREGYQPPAEGDSADDQTI
jgi:hypothetical protein